MGCRVVNFEIPDVSVTKWAIVVLSAITISVGLSSQFDMSDRAKRICAAIAYASAGTALILGQF